MRTFESSTDPKYANFRDPKYANFREEFREENCPKVKKFRSLSQNSEREASQKCKF